MQLSAMIISILFTIVVLVLSIITISKGYGYKHKIDPMVDPIPNNDEREAERKTS